jgi:hypothetical protein
MGGRRARNSDLTAGRSVEKVPQMGLITAMISLSNPRQP